MFTSVCKKIFALLWAAVICAIAVAGFLTINPRGKLGEQSCCLPPGCRPLVGDGKLIDAGALRSGTARGSVFCNLTFLRTAAAAAASSSADAKQCLADYAAETSSASSPPCGVTHPASCTTPMDPREIANIALSFALVLAVFDLGCAYMHRQPEQPQPGGATTSSTCSKVVGFLTGLFCLPVLVLSAMELHKYRLLVRVFAATATFKSEVNDDKRWNTETVRFNASCGGNLTSTPVDRAATTDDVVGALWVVLICCAMVNLLFAASTVICEPIAEDAIDERAWFFSPTSAQPGDRQKVSYDAVQ